MKSYLTILSATTVPTTSSLPSTTTPAFPAVWGINSTPTPQVPICPPSTTTITPTQDPNKTAYRLNMKFTGCPNNANYVYACIISDNNALGTVSGEGLYNANQTITIHAYPKYGNTFVRWNDNNTDNPRQIFLSSDTLLIAYFHSPVSIDNVEQGGYVVMTKQLSISVSGAEQQPIRVFDVMGRLVGSANAHHSNPVTFPLPSSGIYLLRVGNNKPTKLLVSGL